MSGHVERTNTSASDARHANDHDKRLALKADRDGSGRMERHSGE